jgi:hypothetical protein
MIGALAIQSILFTKDTPEGGIFRKRGSQTIHLQDPNKCWVRRDPNMTQEFQAEFLRKESAKHGAEADPDPGIPSLFTVPVVRVISGVGYGVDDEYRCIRNLPSSTPAVSVYGHTDVVPSDSSQRPCFICGNEVETHPEQPEWTAVGLGFYGHKNTKVLMKTETKYDGLIKHCNEHHPKDMFFFCHNIPLEVRQGVKYTIRLHIQKGLRKVLERAKQLDYDLFLTALKYNKPWPLRHALSRLFGMMRMEPVSTKDIKTVAKYKDFRHEVVVAFQKLAMVSVNEMFAALIEFDFRPLLPSGKDWKNSADGNDNDVYHIWNATNLFFRRGLYNDEPFPAIRNVNIPDETLEDFQERPVVAAVPLRKLNKRKLKKATTNVPAKKSTVKTETEEDSGDIVLPSPGDEDGKRQGDL